MATSFSVLKCKKLNQAAVLPCRQTEGSAGYDLVSPRSFTLMPGAQTLVMLGFAMEIRPGWMGLVKSRSGLAVKYQVETGAGVIDSDFRGDVGVLVRNVGDAVRDITAGERIAQMLFLPIGTPDVVEVDELSPTGRGAGGFGSTGTGGAGALPTVVEHDEEVGDESPTKKTKMEDDEEDEGGFPKPASKPESKPESKTDDE